MRAYIALVFGQARLAVSFCCRSALGSAALPSGSFFLWGLANVSIRSSLQWHVGKVSIVAAAQAAGQRIENLLVLGFVFFFSLS
jgi:hypothetical protein